MEHRGEGGRGGKNVSVLRYQIEMYESLNVTLMTCVCAGIKMLMLVMLIMN